MSTTADMLTMTEVTPEATVQETTENLRRRLALAELSNGALLEEVKRHRRISKKRLEDIRKLKRRIGIMEAKLDARH